MKGRRVVWFENNKRYWYLHFDRIGFADHGGFSDGGMGDQRIFQFYCSDSVTCHLQNLVRPAEKPEVIVIVSHSIVAGVVDSRKPGEVDLLEFLSVVPERHELSWPWVFDHHVAFLPCSDWFAFFTVHVGLDSCDRECRATGFERYFGYARLRADQYSAGFSLPPSVDDLTFFAADVFEVPVPGFGVYWFTNAAQ